MSDELDPELLAELVTQLGRERGYASFFQWHDRQVMERGIVTDLLSLAHEDFPSPLPPVSSLASDPPDCVITANDSRIGVEVTELVDRSFLEAVVREEREGDTVYDWAAWDRDKFFDFLNARITAKGRPTDIFGGPFDEYVLLVHTAEPGLDPETVQQWLSQAATADPGIISRGYIIFDYRPGEDRLVVKLPLSASPAGEA